MSHLESEVPLGAFLSGGTDSSTVVALMCRHAAGRVQTFSIGFAEAQYDESQAARAVATQLGTQHTELVVRPDVEEIFESVAAMFDEPFADSSAIPTFLVAQLARESVTVALSGDGGDELFGGYTRYGETLRRAGGKGGVCSRLLAAVGLMLPHAFPGRNRLVDLGRSRLGRYASSVVQPVRVDEGGVASPWHPAGRRTVDEQLNRFQSADEAEDFAAAMMRLDLETYLAGDILTKVDRTSMAVSLEARVPLLDFDLVDFALRIPGDLRVTSARASASSAGRFGASFRTSCSRHPSEALRCRLRSGSGAPCDTASRLCGARLPPSSNISMCAAVERLVTEHSIGRRDHSVLLWRLIGLDYWLAAFADGRLGRPPLVPAVRHYDDPRAICPGGGQARRPRLRRCRTCSCIRTPRCRCGQSGCASTRRHPGYARGVFEICAGRITWISHSSS